MSANLYNPEFQCCVKFVGLNFGENEAVVMVPKHNSPDMTGAISWVSRLMPEVRSILVSEGSTPSVTYLKVDGGWLAMEQR